MTDSAQGAASPLEIRERPRRTSVPYGNDDTLPFFSPNQGTEDVLHSIFSPYFCCPGTMEKKYYNGNSSLRKPRDECDLHEFSEAKSVKDDKQPIQIPPIVPTTSSGEAVYSGKSHYSVKGLHQYHYPSKTIHCKLSKSNSFESAASVDNNTWFVLSTPAGGRSAMYFASPISEISALSDRSFRSLLEIPNIEMLSFDFVKQCTSKDLLQKIITVLTTEDKFPGLLRVARNRWNAICAGNEAPIEASVNLPILPPKSQMRMLPGSRNEGQNIEAENHRRQGNESTLVMSLSDSSCLAGEGLSDKTDVNLSDDARVSPSGAMNEQVSKTCPEAATKPPTPIYAEMPQRIAASTAVSGFRTAFKRDSDASSYDRQFERLTKAKDEAERRIKRLEEAASKSTIRTRELGLLIDSLKRQNQQLHQRSNDDKEARDKAIKEANNMKDRFQRVLKELNDRLTQATEQERLLQSHQRDRRELNSMLKDSMRQFTALKQEQDTMLAKLARAVNRSDLKIQNMDVARKKAIVDEAVKKITSGNAAAEALREAFECAEDDRRAAEQALEKSQLQLQKSVMEKRRLERENQLLSAKIQSMSDEMAEKNEEIDNLIKAARNRQRKEWEAQENHYQRVIRHLQQQIRSEEASVSIKLFEAKVKEARRREAECFDKQRQIKSLSEKVATLEKKIESTITVAPKPPTSRVRPALTVVTNMTPSVPTDRCDKENTAPSMTLPHPSSVTKQKSTRAAIVQRAGGRKALLAQVKQMRSPKFNNAEATF